MRSTFRQFRALAYQSASRSALVLYVASFTLPLEQLTAAAPQPAPNAPSDPSQQIVVIAPPLFRDIQPERELDEDAIASYGLSTIDELLGEIQGELGGDEDAPLIIVNGQRLNDLSEIGALPVEALRDVTVLPRGSALRAGGASSQRVVSLTLRRRVRSETVTAAHNIATDGDWNADRGEAIVTNVRGDTRFNLALRGRGETALLESERNIIQPASRLPYALGGNVVGYPNSLGEIDPALSELAGEIVTVAPLPGTADPTLADFAASANEPALTDLGRFRTLRPRTRNYDLNASFATRLAAWLTTSGSIKLGRSRSSATRGLASGLLVLSPDNVYSPFSREVGIAILAPHPLRYRSGRDSGEVNLTFDAEFGLWSANLHAQHLQSKDVSQFERQASFAPIALDDTQDPFGSGLSDIIAVQTEHVSSRAKNDLLQLSMNGPALKLPAGDVQAVVEGRLGWNKLYSNSTFSVINPAGRFNRSEQSGRISIEVPVTSRANNFGAAIGDLSATGEFTRIHFSDAGTLKHHALALIWEPRPILRLRAAVDETEAPAPITTLGNPVVVTPGVRVFDPLTGETVDVVQITGGNPLALPQTTSQRRLSAILRLVPRLNLQLNAEYSDTDRRNFLASLPDSSAAVMLAFPDRFVRDANGVLTTVDLRPVNFDSEREKRFRWGFSMNAKLGGRQASASTGPAGGGAPARRAPPKPSTYLQLTANHTMVFSDRIAIRPGLPPVDLIHGGAIGIGGGRLRHQADATVALTSGGLGARLGINWRGKSSLITRIGNSTDTLRFSPVLGFNLRLFAEGGRLVPHWKWAKSLRLSLDAINLTNQRQKVRDSAGSTPLQYQPGYRDPIGRTIEIELRKVF